MAAAYTETPDNFNEIGPFVQTDIEDIKRSFFSTNRIVFYDACSFQRHSNLAEKEKRILIQYFIEHGIFLCITKCVFMELTSDYHRLSEEQIHFIQELHKAGIKVAIFSEEYTYNILSECFSTNKKINEYLVWAVRSVKSPVSTIEYTLKADEKLYEDVIEAKNLKQSDLYHEFFTAVRGRKEHADNLGEELIAVCIHILSYLPGVTEGKLCVLTDDKGAAAKIHSVMRRTNPKNRGAKILLFSTPKLVQNMYREHMAISEEEMVKLISKGTSGKIAVMGITPYDLSVNEKISMTGRELVRKIMEPNGIEIVF